MVRSPAFVRQRPDYSESLREQAAWQAEGGSDHDYDYDHEHEHEVPDWKR
jgi:hypothetical protein